MNTAHVLIPSKNAFGMSLPRNLRPNRNRFLPSAVEVTGWLIRRQDFRLHDQRTGQRHPLLPNPTT